VVYIVYIYRHKTDVYRLESVPLSFVLVVGGLECFVLTTQHCMGAFQLLQRQFELCMCVLCVCEYVCVCECGYLYMCMSTFTSISTHIHTYTYLDTLRVHCINCFL
jgi:hypothetical protein